MSEELFWDQDSLVEVSEEDLSDGTLNTFIRVNGSDVKVDPGVSFAKAIKNVAIDAEFGKFRVFLDNKEVKPSNAPSTFEAGMKVEIRPYDKAAIAYVE